MTGPPRHIECRSTDPSWARVPELLSKGNAASLVTRLPAVAVSSLSRCILAEADAPWDVYNANKRLFCSIRHGKTLLRMTLQCPGTPVY